MRIYKYTSINSAISILKNNGVGLSNPKYFNDPNDCSFSQDKKDKERIEKLITDYFTYKVCNELVGLKKIQLTKNSKAILNGFRKELDVAKCLLNKHPYFDGIPGFNMLSKLIGSKSKEFDELLTKEKQEFQAKIDKQIKAIKESALVSCFSKRNDSILMWSHYACSHKGVCIEYERPDSVDFGDVIYSKNRPFIKLYKAVSHAIALDILNKDISDKEMFPLLKDTLKPFFVKSKDWNYEQEIRCLYTSLNLPDDVVVIDKCYVLKMDYPTAIYVGCNAGGEELDHLYQLARNRKIPVFFMKKSERTFNVLVDKDYEYSSNSRPKTQEITLLRLISDVENALNSKTYLAAFSASLIIPAICSQVECSEMTDSKERYIEWFNRCLTCEIKGHNCEGIANLTGNVIWNLKEKLFSDGNVNVFGKYENFDLNKLVLRIEERKNTNIYVDVLGEGDITINITKFCCDIINQARRCYDAHKEDIESLPQLPIEDFDAELESMHECAVINENIAKNANRK